MAASVVITGLGFVTSIGNDRGAVLASLRGLRSGIERHDFLLGADLPVKVAGTIKDFETSSPFWTAWRWPEGYSIGPNLLRGLAPHGLYAVCAMEQAIADARLAPSDLMDEGTGLHCASAGSPFFVRQHLNQIHDSNGTRVAPMAVVNSVAGTLNFTLASHYGIRGAVSGFVSACASSSHALAYGFEEIRCGRQDRILVVGGEDLTWESVFPFHGMRALSRNPSPERASRPFDRQSDGFVATGGAVTLVLESAASAARRGVPSYAEIRGWGQAADGGNIAVSDPSGSGLARAMRLALRSAGIEPAEVDYVNAHATSTPAGDPAEAAALQSVFALRGHHPAVSSLKALTGHGLSMSGAMETAFCALCLREGLIPGAANLEQPHAACAGLDFPDRTLEKRPRYILKNSCGFGGSNVCLVLAAGRN